MKRVALVTLLALLAGWLAGCSHETADDEHSEAAPLELFEKGRGVRLPDDMRQRLGVETVDVAEKHIASRREKLVQVFRSAEEARSAVAVMLLSEAEANVLRAGQSIELRPGNECSDSQPTMVTGTLARLEPRTSAVLGQVEALVEFADPQRRYPAGSFLAADLTVSRSNLVSAIPSGAVVASAEGSFVYTANGSHFTRTPVRLGAASDGWVEVVDGLYAGDAVVAKGADTLWMIELCALKGGTPCCPVTKKQ